MKSGTVYKEFYQILSNIQGVQKVMWERKFDFVFRYRGDLRNYSSTQRNSIYTYLVWAAL